ncbi:MAG TPA: FAD binding domain-containing protein [Roseiarcus sp.]|nr:FAD binding domain-containing protein [Roseiarcus sp.]
MSEAVVATSDSPAAEYLAGGTDLSERRRSGLSQGALIDVNASPEMAGISWSSIGGAAIGSLTTIEAMARDARIASAYPGLAAAAVALATPQIRRQATVGGNLAQRTRCWYYRDPRTSCLKKGGSNCPARTGNHLYGVIFDLGPCVAPHPSTLAVALLSYDAKIATDRRAGLTIGQLLGDGANGAADNTLENGELIKSVELAPPMVGERALYKRAIARAYAEWPLVEVVVRAVIVDGAFQFVRLIAGGVAPVPIELTATAAAISGEAASLANIARAAALSIHGAKPLKMTSYKLDLLKGLVQDLLERISS